MNGRSRKVSQIIQPRPTVEGAGVRLQRCIPTGELEYLDPFLLLDHFGSDDPEDYLAGFPMHPHRGIETVTYVLAGAVRHEDTLGNAGEIGSGDVQWMTSGRGIMHEEMPLPVQGHIEGSQLWVNLPAKLKMSQPGYQEVPAGQIPQVETRDGALVRVIVGEANGVRGPVTEIAAAPIYLDVSVPVGSRLEQPTPRGHTAFAYVFNGEGFFGSDNGGKGIAVSEPHLVVFGDGDYVQVAAGNRTVRFLFASGKPPHEPIVRHGPFVMNTREEIVQALEDLRAGTFVK